MKSEHYEKFKALLARGLRKAASEELQLFVDSFEGTQDRVNWTRWFFDNEQFGHKIQHQLYRGIIFPVLLAGYKERNPSAIFCLARTCQNLYQSKDLWEKIEWKTDYDLLKELVELEPNNATATAELLDRQLKWFRYAEHEWPAGILFGHDGASAEQCDEILSEVELARRLDATGQFTAYLDQFVSKVREYKKRDRTPQ